METMKNSTETKPQKSFLWIVATIIANILIFSIVWAVATTALDRIAPQLFLIDGAEFFVWMLGVLVVLFGAFNGVRYVKKKTTIASGSVLKIALTVIVFPILFQVIGVMLTISNEVLSVSSWALLRDAVYDLALFAVVYISLKRLSEDSDEPSETQQFQSTDQSNQPQQPSQMQMPQSPLQRWLPTILGIVIVVLAGGGVLAYQQWWGGSSESPVSVEGLQEQPSGTTPAEFPEIKDGLKQGEGVGRGEFSTKIHEFTLHTFGWHTGTPDQKLVRVNRTTGEVETAVESVREASGAFLRKYAIPKDNPNMIIYTSFMPETDNPTNSLYQFNTNTNAFMKMKVNEVFDGWGDLTLRSYKQDKVVWIPWNDSGDNGDTKIMYLVDLLNDTYRELVKLTGNETFDGGGGGFSSDFDVYWTGDAFSGIVKVKYAVYDQSKKGNGFDPYDENDRGATFIEYREVDTRN